MKSLRIIALVISINFVGCGDGLDDDSGLSKLGETCSNSSECRGDLRCLDGVCGGGLNPVKYDESRPSTGCNSNNDCWSLSPFCKEETLCVECLNNVHCDQTSYDRFCRIDPSSKKPNYCVECLEHADCTDPREPYCDTSNTYYHCTECFAHEHCTDPKEPYCVDSWCKECTLNEHCADPEKPICRYNRCREP